MEGKWSISIATSVCWRILALEYTRISKACGELILFKFWCDSHNIQTVPENRNFKVGTNHSYSHIVYKSVFNQPLAAQACLTCGQAIWAFPCSGKVSSACTEACVSLVLPCSSEIRTYSDYAFDKALLLQKLRAGSRFTERSSLLAHRLWMHPGSLGPATGCESSPEKGGPTANRTAMWVYSNTPHTQY